MQRNMCECLIRSCTSTVRMSNVDPVDRERRQQQQMRSDASHWTQITSCRHLGREAVAHVLQQGAHSAEGVLRRQVRPAREHHRQNAQYARQIGILLPQYPAQERAPLHLSCCSCGSHCTHDLPMQQAIHVPKHQRSTACGGEAAGASHAAHPAPAKAVLSDTMHRAGLSRRRKPKRPKRRTWGRTPPRA